MDVDGNEIILITSTSTDQYAVSKSTFIVNGSVAGNVVDLTPPYAADSPGFDPDASGLEYRATVAYVSEDTRINDLAWSAAFVGSNDGDYILEGREKAEITVWLQQEDTTNGHWELGTDTSVPFIDTASELLQAKTEFTIQLDTGGGVISISRGIPIAMDAVMNLN